MINHLTFLPLVFIALITEMLNSCTFSLHVHGLEIFVATKIILKLTHSVAFNTLRKIAKYIFFLSRIIFQKHYFSLLTSFLDHFLTETRVKFRFETLWD